MGDAVKTLDRLIDYLFRTVVPDDYPFSGADDRAVRTRLTTPSRTSQLAVDAYLREKEAPLRTGRRYLQAILVLAMGVAGLVLGWVAHLIGSAG